MNQQILIILTLVLYLGAVVWQGLSLAERVRAARFGLFALGLPAVILHAYLLHQWIDVSSGQNLTFFNMLSLVIWLISVLVILASIRQRVESLSVIVFPLAVLSILFVLAFPRVYVIKTASDPAQLIHILLAVVTFSVLCLAGLQAILLAILDFQLNKRRSFKVIAGLPALQTMETLLFQTIWVGFILLSISIASGFAFFQQMIVDKALHKTVLVIFAWVIFAVLLFGRHCFGWRGRKAIYYTLSGVFVLIIAYFGSKLLVEFIL